jgi:hypothetical protein
MNQPIYQQPNIFTTEPSQDNFFIASQDFKKNKCRKNTLQCLCITTLITGMNLLTFTIGYYYGTHENHQLNDGSY